MAEAGWRVLAGVRSAQDGADLVAAAPQRITAVELDVTDDAQIAALADQLPDRLDAVVNNAGIAVGGAIEALPLAELRQQFDVNVIGQVAVTQAVLPRLREARGRILFISSISGMVSSPMLGAYSASKFALEAIADAMRIELRPWGISVALIQPGQIDTDLWRTAPEMLEHAVGAMSSEHQALYARHIAGTRKGIPRAQRMAVPVEIVAKTIEQALTASHPRARYPTGRSARATSMVARFGPRPVVDAALGAMTGVPRKGRAH
jgi:NAD(P)-dependent dehydrogenase (short-subunit alcohol dehydrogenase family)